MNEDQQNFESLGRLLALKRHETPPPGYFNKFSREVIARIRAGEAEEPAGWLAQVPWLLRWLQNIETKPVFAGGFATVLCALLLFGAVMAQRPDVASQASHAFLQPAPQGSGSLPMVAAVTAPITMAPRAWEQPNAIMIDNSTNPLISFGSPAGEQGPRIQMLPFQESSGN